MVLEYELRFVGKVGGSMKWLENQVRLKLKKIRSDAVAYNVQLYSYLVIYPANLIITNLT